MKLAIVTLTKGGLNTAKKVKDSLEDSVDIFSKSEFNGKDIKRINGSLRDFVGEIFYKYEFILFIMATGIVVRVIAPYIKDKTRDPGIMVMDEKGKFIISLLSGHLGGANSYTEKIAKKIDATGVITTASDVLGLISVDMLAKKLNCKMESLKKAKDITSDIVNEKKVGIISDIPINLQDYEKIKIINRENIKLFDSIIYITNKVLEKPHFRSIQLIPRNIVIGVGCRRGTKTENIIEAIKRVLVELNLRSDSIKCLTSVDIKKDEPGILEAGEYFDVDVQFIDRDKIKIIEDKFEGSNFVKKTIGVAAVSEPCGYISSNRGKCIMKKRKFKGITLSVWEDNSYE